MCPVDRIRGFEDEGPRHHRQGQVERDVHEERAEDASPEHRTRFYLTAVRGSFEPTHDLVAAPALPPDRGTDVTPGMAPCPRRNRIRPPVAASGLSGKPRRRRRRCERTPGASQLRRATRAPTYRHTARCGLHPPGGSLSSRRTGHRNDLTPSATPAGSRISQNYYIIRVFTYDPKRSFLTPCSFGSKVLSSGTGAT